MESRLLQLRLPWSCYPDLNQAIDNDLIFSQTREGAGDFDLPPLSYGRGSDLSRSPQSGSLTESRDRKRWNRF